MDLRKCGAFIAEHRKARGLTQKELAERLNVTDKAVSKWETGKGFPDVSILPALSEAIGVSVAELVNGESIAPETITAQTDSAVISALKYSKGMARTTVGVILIIAGAALALSRLYIVGAVRPPLTAAGAAVVCGVLLLLGKRLFPHGISRRAAGIVSFALALAAAAAEALPFGIVMKFAAPPGVQPSYELCSYFELLPFGYGIVTPLATAVMTCVTALLGLLWLILNKDKLANACFVCGIIAALLSVIHFFFLGAEAVTEQSAAVTVLLAGSAAFRAISGGKA